MNYPKVCTCDAKQFYKKYQDEIDVILSAKFTQEDISKTPSREDFEDNLEDSLEGEHVEADEVQCKPRSILHSEQSKSPRKNVTFTDDVSTTQVPGREKQNVVSMEDVKREMEKLLKKKGTNVEPELDEELAGSERSSIILSAMSMKSASDEDFLNVDQIKKLSSPEAQYKGGETIQYLKMQESGEECFSERGDGYDREKILQDATAKLLMYGLYGTCSAGEGEQAYSMGSKAELKDRQISESQWRAEDYLKDHNISDLFHFLGSHLVASNTENPIEFLINLLDSCLKYRDYNDKAPLFFTSKYIKSLFDSMDRMNTGSITLNQYRNGMITLGIKAYEKYPKTDENYMVSKITFTCEALKSLRLHLDEMIKVISNSNASLLWSSRARSSLKSA